MWVAIPAGALLLAMGPGATADDSPPSAGIEVKFSEVFEFDTPAGPLRLVAYEYRASAGQVRVADVGILPGRGSLRYLSRRDEVVFLHPDQGTLVASFRLPPPTQLMGASSLELPDDAQFRAGFQGRWGRTESFAAHALVVLGRSFPLGYAPSERDGQGRILTTWEKLRAVNEPLRAEIAVLVAFPAHTTKRATFAVSYQVRERRSHTAWRTSDLSEETLSAAADFIKALMASMEAP